jgi:hypothetical protein
MMTRIAKICFFALQYQFRCILDRVARLLALAEDFSDSRLGCQAIEQA